jgi:hypothetical protein
LGGEIWELRRNLRQQGAAHFIFFFGVQ